MPQHPKWFRQHNIIIKSYLVFLPVEVFVEEEDLVELEPAEPLTEDELRAELAGFALVFEGDDAAGLAEPDLGALSVFGRSLIAGACLFPLLSL